MRLILVSTFCLALFVSNVFSQNYCQFPNLFIEKKSRIKKISVEKYKNVKHYGKNKKLNIVFSTPKDNYNLQKRPLIIGVHGGGFMDICPVFGCYKYFSVLMQEQFTKRGFISASVEYRLHPRQRNFCAVNDLQLKEAHYYAVQDVRDAIKWIIDNADRYNIDKENVFLMGNSAGASTVMNAAFLMEDDLAPLVIKKYGGLAKRTDIKGVLAYSGALYDLNYINRTDQTAIFLAHGLSDTTVPIDHASYFGCENRAKVYGSRKIADKTRQTGFPTETYFFNGGHDYTKNIQNETARKSVNFIKKQIGCN